jgi:hypothetical protein
MCEATYEVAAGESIRVRQRRGILLSVEGASDVINSFPPIFRIALKFGGPRVS